MLTTGIPQAEVNRKPRTETGSDYATEKKKKDPGLGVRASRENQEISS